MASGQGNGKYHSCRPPGEKIYTSFKILITGKIRQMSFKIKQTLGGMKDIFIGMVDLP